MDEELWMTHSYDTIINAEKELFMLTFQVKSYSTSASSQVGLGGYRT